MFSKTTPIHIKDVAGFSDSLKCVKTPHITQSVIKTFTVCPRRLLLRYIFDLGRRRQQHSFAPSAGTLVHAILAAAYKNIGGTIEDAVTAAHDQTLKPLIETLTKQITTDLSGETEKSLKAVQDAWSVAKAVGEIFLLRYPPEATLNGFPDCAVEFVAVERKFNFSYLPPESELTVNDIEIGGTPDAILKVTPKKGDPYLIVMDHKTTTKDLKTAITGFSYNPQVLMGATLAEREFKLPVRGFIFNVIKMPTIRYCGKDKTFQDYVDRCIRWYADTKDGEKMRSWSIGCSEQQRKLADSAFWRTLETIRFAIAMGTTIPKEEMEGSWLHAMLAFFPATYTGCSQGFRDCDFVPLCEACSAGASGRLSILLNPDVSSANGEQGMYCQQHAADFLEEEQDE